MPEGRHARPGIGVPRVKTGTPLVCGRLYEQQTERFRPMTVLEGRDVTMVFREGSQTVTVLNGASLSLDRGEIVALEGPSGSGKTTFLTILGCMLTPSSGRVSIDGREVDPDRPDLLPGHRRTSIGFVFQQFNLFPALTAAENVEYALNLKGTKGVKAQQRPPACLRPWGLPTGPVSCRVTSPADRSSGWRSPAPGRRGTDPPGRRADREPRHSCRYADPGAVARDREAGKPGATDRDARPEGPRHRRSRRPDPGRNHRELNQRNVVIQRD